MAESDKRLQRRSVTDFARARQLAGSVQRPVTPKSPVGQEASTPERSDGSVPVPPAVPSPDAYNERDPVARSGDSMTSGGAPAPARRSSEESGGTAALEAMRTAGEPAVPPDAVLTEIAAPGKGVRVTIYPTSEAIDYIDECLYLARRAKRTKLRDRTVLFRAFGEAVRISGFDIGNAADEAALIRMLVERLAGRRSRASALP